MLNLWMFFVFLPFSHYQRRDTFGIISLDRVFRDGRLFSVCITIFY